MPKLHFYISDDLEKTIRRRAEQARMPLSCFLAELVRRETEQHAQWPKGYFDEVFGCWEGDPLQRENEGDYEQRSALE